MSSEAPFARFKTKAYIGTLDSVLLQLLTSHAGEELAPLSVLGFPRFFLQETYQQLCERHNLRESNIEAFFQSYEKDRELSIAEPIRKVLRYIFASQFAPSEQLRDFELVLSAFRDHASMTKPALKGKYEAEITYLEYFLTPPWAMTRYTTAYIRAALQPELRATLRRLIRAFDDFKQDALFATKNDSLVHEALRCTINPWRTAPADRTKRITAVLDPRSTEPLHLLLSEELLQALLKKRDIEEVLSVAKQLEKIASKARLLDWQGLAIRYQARAYLHKDEYRLCEKALERARDLLKEQDSKNRAGEIKLAEISADLYRLIGDFDRASETIDICIEYYSQYELLYQYANAVFKKAKILSEQPDSDNEAVVKLLQLVEPIFAKMIDPTGRGNILNMHASCLLDRDQFDDGEVQRLLVEAEVEHERGHSESGLINALILRAKREWRHSTDLDKGIALAAEAIQRIEKRGGSDLYGLFNAREVKARLLRKGMRYDELRQEIRKLKLLNQRLSKGASTISGSFESRARAIEQLQAAP
ncbi:hypothetical protein QA645_05120 [Bradyrhizobium sp. CIAT3101]|uniref:hypothetical protein n=1 Tax=Bradyrhizobium sp. CIAT3101 TaxID=439387 RepID=UPI0024B0AC71|nr:hypothetical protein [Bradyrhizobium sp. CIAT3101]WFU82135.1 hypothetical protein QA645_05120 [Bradyrhizobium sp. CIAT3101]